MTLAAVVLRGAVTGVLLVLVFAVSSCGDSEANGKVAVVRPQEAATMIESSDYVVIDLRSKRAFEAGHVRGAVHLPYRSEAFKQRLEGLDPDAKYLLYSRDGSDADRAADDMVEAGFDHVVDAGSFVLIAIAGAPLE